MGTADETTPPDVTPVDIELDFYADWLALLRRSLIDGGYEIPENASDQDIEFMYFNVRRRVLDEQPREVLFSREFSCPANHSQMLDVLAEVARRGENLNPHLSKGLLDARYNDALLNEWGIHHFHLGPKLATSQFSVRSGDLLFARVTDNAICMIDVMPHGSWGKMHLVEILVRNWPHLTNPYKLNGVTASTTLTEADRKVLRSKSVTTFIEIDGAVYGPPGGGFSSSGLSINVVRLADMLRDRIRFLEVHVRDSRERIVDELRSHGHMIEGRVRLRLELRDDVAFAVHDASQIRFHLGSLTPTQTTSVVEL